MIMREIKFRAYHKNTKEMYEVFSFCHAFIKVCIGIGTASEKIPSNIFEPLMQFTGLKDVNGKNIYEGDILNFHIKGLGEGLSKCYYSSACFYLEVNGQKDPFPLGHYEFRDDIILEIIGNIHENPELLCTSQST